LAKKSAPPSVEVAVPATWTWAADHEHRPKWRSLATTPGKVPLTPNRVLRVELPPQASDTDLAALLSLLPTLPVVRIALPNDGGITAAGLDQLAALSGYEKLSARCGYDPDTAGRHDWALALDGHPTRPRLVLDLLHWPGADVARAAGAIGSLREVDWGSMFHHTPFPLAPLFRNRGLRVLEFEGGLNKEYDWTGLSGLGELRQLKVHKGEYNAGFWDELGRLPRLERAALEWLERADPQPGALGRLKKLAELSFAYQIDALGPAAWQAIGQLPAVKKLKVDQGDIDDDMAAGLGSLQTVEDAYIWNVKFTDARMASLCRLTRLRSLVLCENSGSTTPLTDAGFREIGKLTKLESLHLQGFEGVGPAGWPVLRSLKRLRELKLTMMPPFDFLEAVGELPTVQTLEVLHCNSVTAAGWAAVAAMPALRTFAAHAWSVRPYTNPFPELARAVHLESLTLGDLNKLDDADLHVLATLPNLSALRLWDMKKVGDAGVAALAGMPGLRQLTLSRIPKLTDACLRTLGRMTQLRELSLRCTGKMTDTGLATLAGLKQLESLELDYARNLTASRLLKLTQALPLRQLAVAECPHVGDDDLLALTRHPTLEKVRFWGCKNITQSGRAAVHATRPDWVL
jgi:hypothetical protein